MNQVIFPSHQIKSLKAGIHKEQVKTEVCLDIAIRVVLKMKGVSTSKTLHKEPST